MHNDTRKAFNKYCAALAQLYGVENVTTSFSATPVQEQKLIQKVQESSDFLKLINMVPVTNQAGEKVGIGVAAPHAGRTDTTQRERKTSDLSVLDPQGYFCVKTDYDTHLRYAMLDAWRHHPDFAVKVQNAQLRSEALARIMVGFNGVRAAAETNRDQNPLLQDVNKGWLQHVRERASERVLNAGKGGTGKVKIGKGGDYANLDAAVFDLKMLLEPWYQEDTQLVAIVSGDLLHDKYMPIINGQSAATEKLAADIIISQKRLGGQQAYKAPYMPGLTVMLTRLDNLSIYSQEGSRRRHIKDKPERDRVETYSSSNDAYVVEDLGCVAILENIEIIPADATTPETTGE